MLFPLTTTRSSGCNKLQRKLLFADSLAKLPYKIGAIRGILTNLVNNLKELQFKTKTSGLSSTDVAPAFSMFNDLQKSTAGLCRFHILDTHRQPQMFYIFRGQSSLPVLAVELQKSCDLLQVKSCSIVFKSILWKQLITIFGLGCQSGDNFQHDRGPLLCLPGPPIIANLFARILSIASSQGAVGLLGDRLHQLGKKG